MKRAVQWMLNDSAAKPDVFAVPEGVDVYRRVAVDREVFIVENDSTQAQTIPLPTAMNDVLTDSSVRSVRLPVGGVAVLVQPNPK